MIILHRNLVAFVSDHFDVEDNNFYENRFKYRNEEVRKKLISKRKKLIASSSKRKIKEDISRDPPAKI